MLAAKKKVLFIVGTMQSGGVSRSMVNLLNVWDRNKYDTSLLILNKKGDVLSKYIPSNVHILWNQDIEDIHSGLYGIKELLCRCKFFLAFGCVLRLVVSLFSRSLAAILISRMMPVISDEVYDLIVDYGGQQQLYYMVDKLHAKKKASFFHNDYSKWPYYYWADKRYYPKVDHIFSVSQVCVDALKKFFPECSDKISLMENIVSPTVISRQAEKGMSEDIKWLIGERHEKVVLVTVAHFCKRKGSDLSIDASVLLKKKGMNFVWLFVGKILEPELKQYAIDRGLNVIDIEAGEKPSHSNLQCAQIVLLGVKSNPYPYMKGADIYVQPSRFEGKSISLDEAKVLCKPIVVTNFSTVGDQFDNGINASICEMNCEDLAKKIYELSNDGKRRKRYSTFLSKHVLDNNDEVCKLYDMLG